MARTFAWSLQSSGASPTLDSRGGCRYVSNAGCPISRVFCEKWGFVRLGFFEQARDPDQEDGADDGDYDRADEAARSDAERAQQPSSDDSSDDSKNDIHHYAVA